MEIILDAVKLQDRETAHSYLKEMLGFPEYYGRNLDALYDCLTEICEETLIRLTAEGGEMPDSPYFEKILGVMRDAEAENPRLQILIGPEGRENAEESDFPYEEAYEDNAEDDASVPAEDGEDPLA